MFLSNSARVSLLSTSYFKCWVSSLLAPRMKLTVAADAFMDGLALSLTFLLIYKQKQKQVFN